MKVLLQPHKVVYQLTPGRIVEVHLAGVDPRVLSYQVDEHGHRHPCSISESAFLGFISDAKDRLTPKEPTL